jgi:hypothetical protein
MRSLIVYTARSDNIGSNKIDNKMRT